MSKHVQAFLWALAYSTIGCGLFQGGSDTSMKNKKDSIYFLASIFRQTQPHVRSLQSLACDAVEKSCSTRQLLSELAKDNPTFSKTEGLELTNISFTKSYPDPFLYGNYVDDPSCYCGPTHTEAHSFIFTTSLALLEDSIVIFDAIVTEPMLHIVFFTTEQVARANPMLLTLLQTCFIRLCNQSDMINESMFIDVIGVELSIPQQSQTNQTLESQMEQVISILNSRKFTQNCHCRECQEVDAAYEACISFIQKHVISLFVEAIN